MAKKQPKRRQKLTPASVTKSFKKFAKMQGIELSECAYKYGVAICDPFNPKALGACIPRAPALPSQKIELFTRFSISLPASATNGALWVTPSLANDSYLAYYTSGTATDFTGQAGYLTQSNISASKINTVKFSSAPYTTAQLQSNPNVVCGRIVSVGVMIEAATPTLYLGGSTVGYASPTHDDVSELSYSDILGQDSAMYFPTTRRKYQLFTSCIDQNEWDYPGNNAGLRAIAPYSNATQAGATASSAISISSIPQGAPPMCIQFSQSAADVGQVFNVTIIEHVEYSGKLTAFLHTPTHADVTGAEAISAAAAQVAVRRVQNPFVETGKELFKEVANVATKAGKVLINSAGAVLTSRAMGSMGVNAARAGMLALTL